MTPVKPGFTATLRTDGDALLALLTGVPLPRLTPREYQTILETLLAIADNESELLDKGCDFSGWLYFRSVRHRVDMAVGAGHVSIPDLCPEEKDAMMRVTIEEAG